MKCETPAGVKRVSGMKSHNNHGSDAGELLDERCLLMVTQPAAQEAAEEPEQNLNRTAVLADSLDEVSGAGRQVSFPPVLSLHTGGVVTP